MIISGGSNIYPREIEEVLLRHTGVLKSLLLAAHTGTGERRWLPLLCLCPEMAVTAGALTACAFDTMALQTTPRLLLCRQFALTTTAVASHTCASSSP